MNCCLQHYIQIDVWDHDTLNRDDFMGKIQIPVSLLSEETTACWFPLGRGSAKENIRGDIFLELTLKASQVLADIKLGNRSTRRRTNSPTPTRRRIKSSRDVGELVVNPIQLIRS